MGHRFADIAGWASAIQASRPEGDGASDACAPVAGRVCETGLRSLPSVAETIVTYDEANRTLEYAATGLLRFVREARNRWQVSAVGPHRATVRFDGVLETRGLAGRLLAVPLRLRMPLETRALLHDLKHYAEHDAPSPRKKRRLARRDRADRGRAARHHHRLADTRRPFAADRSRTSLSQRWFRG